MKNSNFLRGLILLAFVIGISLLHYFTPLSLPMLHDVFQRLYYIPIILAAFWFGFRGGIACALIVSIVYAPHILFQWGGHIAMELEKYLEIVLYNVVGGITGFLSQKEETRRIQLQMTAQGLEESYKKLQHQAKVIIEIEGELRKAERLSTIGGLAAILAHEIRNPLGSIQGTAEILKDDFRPGDRKYEFFEILIKESGRLNRVVEEFLRLAHPQSVKLGECDVMEELHNVFTLVSADAEKRNVRLELVPAQVPLIQGDAEKLRQAFLNIIQNGIQATPPAGLVSVHVSGGESKNGEAGDWVEVVFTDTGKGIPAGLLETIFEPFFTTKPDGTGLGLAIAKKIIEGHGGTMTVKSEVDHGTTFTINLKTLTAAKGGTG